jgi:hypothetical protein
MNTSAYFALSSKFQLIGSILIAICCLSFYKLRPGYIKLLGFYAVISILFSIAQSLVPLRLARVLVNPIGNGFVLSEALVFGLLYLSVVSSINFRKFLLGSLILFGMLCIIVFLQFPEQSFSLIRFGRDFLLIVYALVYFYYLIKALPEQKLLDFPMFWINSAIIFFFSGTLILSFMRDYLVNVLKNDTAGFWAFRNFFRFAFCVGLAYAGWLDWQKVKLKAKSDS